MKVILAICVFLAIVSHNAYVSAVRCTATNQCIETDNTLATCENNICRCRDGYEPTAEGCVQKPIKPDVRVADENTNEALVGALVELKCGGCACQFTFKWWMNGVENSDYTDQTIYFRMGESDVKFKCAVNRGGASSDQSEELTIKVLKEGGTSDAMPKLNLNYDLGMGDGVSLYGECHGYPYGLDGRRDVKYYDENGDRLNWPITQDASKWAERKIVCQFEKNGYTFTERTVNPYPKVNTLFTRVSVKPSEDGPIAFHVSDDVHLYCHVFPPTNLLSDEVRFNIQYEWSTGTKFSRYLVLPQKAAEYDAITCTATYGTTSITSEPYPKIIISDSYLAKPTVTYSPAKPPAELARVALICNTEHKGVQFSWSRSGEEIIGQVDQTIQYFDAGAIMDDTFVCSITKHGYTVTSDAFRLEDQDFVPTQAGTYTGGKVEEESKPEKSSDLGSKRRRGRKGRKGKKKQKSRM